MKRKKSGGELPPFGSFEKWLFKYDNEIKSNSNMGFHNIYIV